MNGRVLIIEDDRFNRRLYRDLLQEAGFSVSLAASAGEGIEAARMQPPDLVVMDLELPDLDGFEATKALRGDPRTANVPVLVVSAHAQQTHEARARAVGADAFMAKPLSFPDFLAAVGRLSTAG